MRLDLYYHVKAKTVELCWMRVLEESQALERLNPNELSWGPSIGTDSSEWSIGSLRKEECQLQVQRSLHRV